jgi:recombination protein RecA
MSDAAVVARPEPRVEHLPVREPAGRRDAPFLRLVRAAALEERLAAHEPWSLDALAGRLAELSGSGSLSLATRIVIEAQERGEPACWIAVGPGVFFPPDMAANGVVLDTLSVVRTSDALQATAAADRLLRCGAFGLIVLDLAGPASLAHGLAAGDAVEPRRMRPFLAGARQARLAQLALRHDTALLCLVPDGGGGPSSMVSLRARARSRQIAGFRSRCELEPIKDKRRGTGWRVAETRLGPPGLR